MITHPSKRPRRACRTAGVKEIIFPGCCAILLGLSRSRWKGWRSVQYYTTQLTVFGPRTESVSGPRGKIARLPRHWILRNDTIHEVDFPTMIDLEAARKGLDRMFDRQECPILASSSSSLGVFLVWYKIL
jgi:hypothetical protein